MSRLIGTKHFYKKLLLLSIPIIMQNAITNFVGLLDNIMVGQMGTEQMAGVAIVNQLIFVMALAIFGGLSGAGIFGAQFYGQGNHEGLQNTFRFKIWIGVVIFLVSVGIFAIFGGTLIRAYLNDGTGGNLELTFRYAKEYLAVMMFEFLPFILVQVYASTLRETGQTLVPMLGGIAAVLVNLVLNYILIFGNFGAPRLGVSGAAIATVIARIVECSIVVAWTHWSKKNEFIVGVYRTLRIPKSLALSIVRMGTPLLMNEMLWAAGVAVTNQCFSRRGLAVIAGVNISSTITNLFNIVFIALGSAVAILVGQHLGAREFTKAKDTAVKVIAFSVFTTMICGGIMFMVASLFPQLYNTSGEVKSLATSMIRITACVMPIQAFLHATYFTIRSGGRTVITFMFDSGFSWVVAIPFTFALVSLTGLDILVIYTLVYLLDLIKSIVGFILLRKGVWIQNIVDKEV